MIYDTNCLWESHYASAQMDWLYRSDAMASQKIHVK